MSEPSRELDLKGIVIAQMQYEELWRAFKELIEHIEPERIEYNREDGKFVNDREESAFRDMASRINCKDISEPGDFQTKRTVAVLLLYPEYLIPLLKCLERQSVTLQTLQGRVGPGQILAKLMW